MIFNTISYLTFLVLVVGAYWLVPQRLRLWLLLAASLLFYGLWRPEFVLLISFSAFVDYWFSLRIHDSKNETHRRWFMIISITINLALLVYFKYTYFIIDNLGFLTGGSTQNLTAAVGEIILPLGISFYTFLSISYTIDVYRREFVPIRNFPKYLTYVMFWPHMIAGPILRAHELIPQIEAPPPPNTERIMTALKVILFGLFLKVGLADNLAPMVDEAFAMKPAQLGGIDVLTMAFGFGLQIYFDFAGYSMISVGSALLIGIVFPQNFNWPYMASSPRDFWRRWHITLSSWIRDYLYLPLSGLRVAAASHQSGGGIDIQFVRTRNFIRITLALFITWFIMGLWHGASWNFALWGVWHALFIFGYRLVAPYLPEKGNAVTKLIGWGITLLIVMLGWIPFRSADLQTTFELYGRLFDPSGYGALAFRENTYLIIGLMFAGMVGLYWLKQLKLPATVGASLRTGAEIIGLSAAMIIVFVFLRPVAQFIYFQF
jgi:D-alanyl-lipoteichoic acid acyltransferase DltB (MBOAT superfamily)